MNIISLTGCSGSGKNYLAEKLIEFFKLEKIDCDLIVSYTTRAIRNGEIDGKDYHFISVEEFEKKIKNNSFIEYVNVNGNYYGTGRGQSNKLFIHIVDPKGVENIKSLQDVNVFSIFLKDFSDGKILNERLKERLNNASNEKERFQTNSRIIHLKEVEIPEWNNGDLSNYDVVENIEKLASNEFDDILKNLVDKIKQHKVFLEINNLKTSFNKAQKHKIK